MLLITPVAPRCAEKESIESYKSSSGNLVFEVYVTVLGVAYVSELAQVGGNVFGQCAHVLFVGGDIQISQGSCTLPAMTLVTGAGRDTWNSNCSRRMVSTRMDRCNSPRPETTNTSGLEVVSTRMLTLVRSSLISRA